MALVVAPALAAYIGYILSGNEQLAVTLFFALVFGGFLQYVALAKGARSRARNK